MTLLLKSERFLYIVSLMSEVFSKKIIGYFYSKY